jgi:hypothetical protein
VPTAWLPTSLEVALMSHPCGFGVALDLNRSGEVPV